MGVKEHVERILKQKNIKKNVLAEKMGVTPSTVTSYLSDNVSIGTLQKMAVALDVTVGELLGESSALKPRDGFVYLPILDVEASAGHGLDNGHEVVEDFLCLKEEDFKADFHLDPARVKIIKVRGDSMEPKFNKGDWIFVDTADTDVNNGIYVVVLNGKTMMKRIQVFPDRFVLKSDNAAYDPIPVTTLDNIRICGKVVGQIVMKRL